MAGNDVKVAALVAKAIYQIIHTMEDQGVPANMLFESFQPYGMNLEQFQAIIITLKNVEAIREDNGVLYANPEVGMALGLV